MLIKNITPNWRNEVRETLQFNTEIVASDSGIEQRWAHMNYPRRRLNFVAMAERDDMQQYAYNYLQKFAGQSIIPDPVQGVVCIIKSSSKGDDALYLERDLPSGDYTIVGGGYPIHVTIISTTPYGAYSVDYNENFDVVNNGYGRTKATIAEPLPINIPSGASVHPDLHGHLGENLDYQAVISTLFEPVIEFMVHPETVTVLPCDFQKHTDGRYIIDMFPNWVNPLRFNINTPIDTVDYGGVIHRFQKVEKPIFGQTMNYLRDDVDDIERLKGLFHRVRGRRNSFWCPSFTCDFTPLAGMNNGEYGIPVEPTHLLTPGEVPDFGIIIFLHDGRWFFREINQAITVGGQLPDGSFSDAYDESFESVGNNPDSYTITFPVGAPFAFKRSDIKMMSVTRLSRFSSDSMTIEWLTSHVAKTLLNIQSCRN